MATKKKVRKQHPDGNDCCCNECGQKFTNQKRTKADWFYAYPDDRNRLIEEAREIVHGYLFCRNKDEGDYKTLDKAARRWLKETKP